MSADTARGTTAARTVDKPIEFSAFQKAIPQDIAESLDQAKPNSTGALAALASGPLLMTETISELDNIPDKPFDQICNDGSKFSGKNFLGKLARYVLTPLKEVYLPLMTWGLPTNFLMVRSCCCTAHTSSTCIAAEAATHHSTPASCRPATLAEPSRQQLHVGYIWRSQSGHSSSKGAANNFCSCQLLWGEVFYLQACVPSSLAMH